LKLTFECETVQHYAMLWMFIINLKEKWQVQKKKTKKKRNIPNK